MRKRKISLSEVYSNWDNTQKCVLLIFILGLGINLAMGNYWYILAPLLFFYIVVRATKNRIHNREESAKHMEEMRQHLNDIREALFNSMNNSKTLAYPKWYALSMGVRQRIEKVITMARRGIDGERVAANARLEAMLDKHGITLNDIPNVEDLSKA